MAIFSIQKCKGKTVHTTHKLQANNTKSIQKIVTILRIIEQKVIKKRTPSLVKQIYIRNKKKISKNFINLNI